MKVAVIGDGTGPHEMFVVVVEAENETDALNKVAAKIISDPDDCAVEQGAVDNHCSPTYQCGLYNDGWGLVYTLKTAPLVEI